MKFIPHWTVLFFFSFFFFSKQAKHRAFLFRAQSLFPASSVFLPEYHTTMSEGTNRWPAKDVLLFIVCLPYICLNIPSYLIARQREKSRPRYWRHMQHEGHPGHTPVPMIPRSIDSSLTLPLSSVPDLQRRKHKTISQNQCLLLSKLPFELRKVIWEECMGGKVLHLTLAKYDGETHDKLVHIVCLGEPKHERCFNLWFPRLDSFDKANMITVCPRQDSKFLSLLLTCRKMLVLSFPLSSCN